MIRVRPLPVLTLVSVPAFALLIGLGAWQLERLAWKNDLIERVHARMSAPPLTFENALRDGIEKFEWRRISIGGHFLYDREVYLFATGKEGQPGLHVVTPLVTGRGQTVLVDRGFIAQEMRDPRTRAAGQVTGDVFITGVVRLSRPPGAFTPKPDAVTRTFYSRDVSAMAQAAGVRASVPVIVEADASPNPGGWPKGGQTRVDFRNEHLQYAITWFGLALVLLVIYVVFHVKHRRITFGSRAGH
ncbi:MAG: SURF1 family protein [Alphaproteobacteria bacterium]